MKFENELFEFIALHIIKINRINLSKAFAVLKYYKPEVEYRSSLDVLNEIIALAQSKINQFDSVRYSELSKKYPMSFDDSNENSFNIQQLSSDSILRIAPNPNSSPAMGSLRMIAVHAYYEKKYNCKVVLRFDDTDPDNKRSRLTSYASHISLCQWMGLKLSKIIKASSRNHIYEHWIERLIENNFIYCNRVVSDVLEGFQNSPELNLELFKNRVNYSTAVFRFRSNKDVSEELSNWVCYRRVKNSHPLRSNLYTPTVNFNSTIDDYEEGVTHMLRGKDLESTEARQIELWDAINSISEVKKPFPILKYWGKLRIPELESSSSKINALIESTGSYVNKLVLNYATISSFNLDSSPFKTYFIESGCSRSEHNLNIAKLRRCILRSMNRPIMRIEQDSETEFKPYHFMWSSESKVLPLISTIKSDRVIYKIGSNYLIWNPILLDYFILE